MKLFEDNFEKAWQHRLQDYEAEPPAGAKSLIFSALRKPSWFLTSRFALVFLSFSIPHPTNDFILFFDQKREQVIPFETTPNNKSQKQILNYTKNPDTGTTPINEITEEIITTVNEDRVSNERNYKSNTEFVSIKNRNQKPSQEKDIFSSQKIDQPSIHGFSHISASDTGNIYSQIPSDLNKVSLPIIKKEQPVSNLSFYSSFMTYLIYSRVTPNKSDDVILDNFSSQSALSFSRLGWRGSLGVEYPVNDRITIYGGAAVNQYDLMLSFEKRPVTPEAFIIEESNLVTTSFSSESVNHEEKYIGLGSITGLNYYVKRGKNLNHLIDISLEFQARINSSEGIQTIRNNQFITNFGYRMEYKCSDQLKFKIQPNLGYSLFNATAEGNLFSVSPFSLGVDFGLMYRYSLKK
ncbi:MAG TPA: hypothetical protein ACFCUD_08800 [Cyclobacteriaceae bacterium]